MSLRHRPREGSHDETAARGDSAGKRAATEALPVQRKAAPSAPPPPSLAWSSPPASEDPFALHLDQPVQMKGDRAAGEGAQPAVEPNAAAGGDKVAKLHYLVDVDVKDLGLKD